MYSSVHAYLTDTLPHIQVRPYLIPAISRPLDPAMLLLRRIRDPEDKVDDHRQEQDDGEERGAEAIIEAGLAAQADGPRAPVVREQRIDHGGHRHDGEHEGGDEGRAVPEVQHADGQSAEDHGEVQP
jgi:hypothetical protein